MNQSTSSNPTEEREQNEFHEREKMDDLLRRMLATPPKPHKKPVTEQKKKTAK